MVEDAAFQLLPRGSSLEPTDRGLFVVEGTVEHGGVAHAEGTLLHPHSAVCSAGGARALHVPTEEEALRKQHGV